MASPENETLTIEAERAGFEALFNDVPLLPGTQVEKVSVDGIPAEWVAAPGVADDRVVYYLHGGGYSAGSCNTHRALVTLISAASGARVLMIEYRLAPENPFPAAVEDALKGYHWLLNQGIKPGHVVVSGDSAGGGLALATLLSLRDAGEPLPAGAAVISPWTDLEGTGESVTTRAKVDPVIIPASLVRSGAIYLNGADPHNPLAAPLYGDYKGLPPLLIQVGDHEVLLDDSTRVAEKARAAGVEVQLEVWPQMWHVWHMAPALPAAQQAIEQMGQFISNRTGSKPAASATT